VNTVMKLRVLAPQSWLVKQSYSCNERTSRAVRYANSQRSSDWSSYNYALLSFTLGMWENHEEPEDRDANMANFMRVPPLPVASSESLN
jgi:hypothetical protein